MLKNILLLYTRPPLPSSGGRERMLLQLLEMLSGDACIDLVYIRRDGDSDASELDLSLREKGISLDTVSCISLPNTTRKIQNIFFRSGSLQERIFFDQDAADKISEMTSSKNYDVVYFDMLRMGVYSRFAKANRRVIDLDDLLSLRYKRALTQPSGVGRIEGTFSGLLPPLANGIVNRLARYILFVESFLIAKSELASLSNYDAVALVSPKEATSLYEKTGVSVYSLPPIVGEPRIRAPVNAQTKNGAVNFLFVGNLRTAQNFQSVKLIADSFLPALEELGIKYVFNIVGGYSELPVPASDKITYHGFVDDIESVYRESSFLLSPIAFGTGIKLKIIDAVMYGIPIVTNSIGAEGLPLENMTSALIDDDMIALAKSVAMTAGRKDLLENMSNEAFESLAVSFSGPVVFRQTQQFLFG